MQRVKDFLSVSMKKIKDSFSNLAKLKNNETDNSNSDKTSEQNFEQPKTTNNFFPKRFKNKKYNLNDETKIITQNNKFVQTEELNNSAGTTTNWITFALEIGLILLGISIVSVISMLILCTTIFSHLLIVALTLSCVAAVLFLSLFIYDIIKICKAQKKISKSKNISLETQKVIEEISNTKEPNKIPEQQPDPNLNPYPW